LIEAGNSAWHYRILVVPCTVGNAQASRGAHGHIRASSAGACHGLLIVAFESVLLAFTVASLI
jgi:hypothetical protein